MFRLNSLDILIFAVYMVSVFFIGFLVGRKKHTRADGFFLARRTLPWYAIGFSMTAAWHQYGTIYRRLGQGS